MGYRSDVSVVFYSLDAKVPGIALKVWFDENYPAKEAKDEWDATISYGEDYVLVSYESVKWYPEYNHPKAVRVAVDKFVDAFEDGSDRDRVAWETVEIGEDLNDITRDASDYADWRLDVRREVVFS